MKSKLALISCFVLVLALSLFLLKGSSERKRLALELSEARAAADLYKNRLDTFQSNQVSAEDLARLRSDQRDAIRLRGEVTSLRKTVASQSGTSAQRVAPRSTPQHSPSNDLVTVPLPEDNPDVRVYKTAPISAQLPAGHSLLVGGWQTQSGKRLFALVDPKVDQASGAITVTSKWAEVPEETAQRLRIGTYVDTSGEQSASLAQFSADSFTKLFENESGVDVLTPPSVSTKSGRQARISVTESRTTPAGTVDLGQQLDIIPTLSEDGQISVILRASVTRPRED